MAKSLSLIYCDNAGLLYKRKQSLTTVDSLVVLTMTSWKSTIIFSQCRERELSRVGTSIRRASDFTLTLVFTFVIVCCSTLIAQNLLSLLLQTLISPSTVLIFHSSIAPAIRNLNYRLTDKATTTTVERKFLIDRTSHYPRCPHYLQVVAHPANSIWMIWISTTLTSPTSMPWKQPSTDKTLRLTSLLQTSRLPRM